MLPSILKNPSLRCQARSRRSGWQQCGRLAAYGSRVCTTHGARKKPRFGTDAPNYKHGKRSLNATVKATHALQRVRLLQVGVDAINGDLTALQTFSQSWEPLLERQDQELAELQKKTKRR